MRDPVLIFAKAPIPGRVKTRLVPTLSPSEAAALYAASLGDVVEGAAADGGEVVVFYLPEPGAREVLNRELPGAELVAQSGDDLGQRLSAAAAWAFERGAERVRIVGGDSPTLPRRLLSDAGSLLESSDLVFGPAADGGYYLVGIRSKAWPAADTVFRGIPWSTDGVLASSRAKARQAGLTVSELPVWYDIDRPEDLVTARAHALPGSRLERVLARLLPPGEG